MRVQKCLRISRVANVTHSALQRRVWSTRGWVVLDVRHRPCAAQRKVLQHSGNSWSPLAMVQTHELLNG